MMTVPSDGGGVGGDRGWSSRRRGTRGREEEGMRGLLQCSMLTSRPLVVPVVLLLLHDGRRLGRLSLLLLLIQLLDGLDLLLELHPPVLEPDLDLALCQAELVRHLYPPPPREVVVRVELLLQLQRLVAGVGLPAAAAETAGAGEEVRTA